MARRKRRKEWIRIDPDNYDELAEIGAKPDVSLDVYVSPFEIPRAVRGYYTKRKGFVVEFKYMTDEKYQVKELGPPEVATRIGKNSGRVLGFEIDVDSLRASSVGVRLFSPLSVIERALETIRAKGPRARSDNTLITQKVLEDRAQELFAGLGES